MKFSEHIRGAALAAGLALSGASSEGGHKPAEMSYSKADLLKKGAGIIYDGTDVIKEVADDKNYIYFRITPLQFVAVPKDERPWINDLYNHLYHNLEKAKSEQEKNEIKQRFDEIFREKVFENNPTALLVE